MRLSVRIAAFRCAWLQLALDWLGVRQVACVAVLLAAASSAGGEQIVPSATPDQRLSSAVSPGGRGAPKWGGSVPGRGFAIRSVAGRTDVVDGIAAVDATLFGPCAAAIDRAGKVYVADSRNHRIRVVDTLGIISTVAGTGDWGYGGDGGLATQAKLSFPCGLAVDATGNVFVADVENHRVRRIDAVTGVISTYAGTGKSGHAGDAGPAVSARLARPTGVAVDDAGFVFIADPVGGSVHKIDGATGAITSPYLTARGRFRRDGSPAVETWFVSPRGVAAGNDGHLYIVDSGDHRIRRVDVATQEITTLAGTGSWNSGWEGGSASNARFAHPESLAIDGNGDVFFVDSERIWQLDRLAGTVTAFAGTGERGYRGDGGLAIDAELRSPRGLAIDTQGNVYVGECGRVRRIDTSGVITTLAGTGTRAGRQVLLQSPVPALEAHLHCVEKLATDGLGNLYLVESENGTPLPYVLRIDAAGTIGLFASQTWQVPGWNGQPEVEVPIRAPSDLTADPSGRVYVSDPGTDRILGIDTRARSVVTVLHTNGFRPETVATDPAGNVYVGGAIEFA